MASGKPIKKSASAQQEKIENIDVKLDGVATRFDRHLEIYAQNGKELAGLKVEVGGLKDQMGRVVSAISALDVRFSGLEDQFEKKFITRDQFWPVKTIVYGLVGVVLITSASAVIGLVIYRSDGPAQEKSTTDAATAAASAAIQSVLQNYQSDTKQ